MVFRSFDKKCLKVASGFNFFYLIPLFFTQETPWSSECWEMLLFFPVQAKAEQKITNNIQSPFAGLNGPKII